MTTTSSDSGVGDTVPMRRLPTRQVPTQRISTRRVPTRHGAHAVDTTPVQRPRLVAVDAARGVALLGMMAVHALVSYDDDGRPTAIYSLSAGRAAAAFAVLAGVGIALLTRRRRVGLGRPARRALAVLSARAAVIGAIGLTLGYADSDIAMVILPYYAVLFLIAVPLVLLPTGALVAVGAALAIGMPFLSHAMRAELPQTTGLNHSLVDLFTDPVGILQELLLTGAYPALSWATYLCAGIVVGRLRLRSSRTAAGLLVGGAVAGVAASALAAVLLGLLGGHLRLRAAGTGDEDVTVADLLAFGGDGVTPTTTTWWLAVQAPHTATPLDLLHTTGTAVALLGALLLLGHVTMPLLRRPIDLVLAPLAAAGSMTLTLYTAHIVFMNSPLDDFDAMPGYVVQAMAALLFALGWRQVVGRGPLESLTAWTAHRVAGERDTPPVEGAESARRASVG